jgi:hypothetical protein
MSATIEIGNLLLKIPGLSPDEARGLGEEVAHRLSVRAAELPVWNRVRRFEALDVSLSLPPGASRQQLAGLIVESIWERILA